jgi:hypothetical protein
MKKELRKSKPSRVSSSKVQDCVAKAFTNNIKPLRKTMKKELRKSKPSRVSSSNVQECVAKAFTNNIKPLRKTMKKELRKSKPSLVSSSNVQEGVAKAFTNNDILFVGAWARDHKGNMILKDWVTRFCTHFKAYSKIKFYAKQVVSLFQTLSSRFLETKVSSLDGSSVWIELQEQVVIERISIVIHNLLKAKKDGMLLELSFNEPKKMQEVQILKIDIESFQTRPGNDRIWLELSEFDHLKINDVILGKYDGRETHCGNLKFLHHMDDYMTKYERTTTVEGKLTLIRQMIASWKKHVATTGRFVVSNGDAFSIVEADDELTLMLGVAGMAQEMIRPIPLGAPDIYLGEKWTIQRTHTRNLEFHRLLASNMKAYGVVAKINTRHQRIAEELSIAGDIVRKMCWDSYPKGPFKGGFKVFDTKVKDWVTVSVEEAIRRTLILLRLKEYFSIVAADQHVQGGLVQDCCVGDAKVTFLDGSRCTSSWQSMLTEGSSPASPNSKIRAGAKRRIPSPMQATLLASPKRSLNTSSLLYSELWSPTMMSPIASSPVKSFAPANSTPSSRLASIPHPVARYHVSQPGLVPTRYPNNCISLQYATVCPTPTSHLSNERLLPLQFHNSRIQLPNPRNIGFWPSEPNNNDFLTHSHIHRTPVNHPTGSPFIIPTRNDQLVWVPFSVPFNTH